MLANTPRPNERMKLGQTKANSPPLGPAGLSPPKPSRKARRKVAAAAKTQSGELMWRHGLGAEFCAVGLLDLEGIDLANETAAGGKAAVSDVDVPEEEEESGGQVMVSLAEVREQRRAATAALADQVVVVSPGAAGGTPALGATAAGKKMVIPLSLDDSVDSSSGSDFGDSPQTPRVDDDDESSAKECGSGGRSASDAARDRRQALTQQRLPTLVACAHDGSTVFISPSGEELWCTAGRPVVACLTGAIGVGVQRDGNGRTVSVGCVAWVTAGGGISLLHSIRPQQLRLTTAVDLLLRSPPAGAVPPGLPGPLSSSVLAGRVAVDPETLRLAQLARARIAAAMRRGRRRKRAPSDRDLGKHLDEQSPAGEDGKRQEEAGRGPAEAPLRLDLLTRELLGTT
jgi:hypothetical protein